MTFMLDWIVPFLIWIVLSFVSHCTEITRPCRAVDTKKSIRVEPDVLGTRKGTGFSTRPSSTNDNSFQENNKNLIKKLAEKSNVAVENQNLKLEVAKLQFELALSKSKNRYLENQQDELLAASSKSAMEARILILEQENLRLIEKESKSRGLIEAKDRLLEVISFLSSDKTTADSIDKVLENNLTVFEDKNTEVLRLLAESKMEISKPVIQASGKPSAPINVSCKSTNETLIDELQHQPTSDSVDDVASPTAASSSFFDTNEETVVEYLIISNLPPSVPCADIVDDFQLMIGSVKHYTTFTDENSQYLGSMAVEFVNPSDARRAYKTYDGMKFEGQNKLWYKAEVVYYVKRQRSYQTEEESVPGHPLAVHQQSLTQDISQPAGAIADEEIQQTATTATHLDEPVDDKNLPEDSMSCEILTRKQKTNQRTNRRKKAKKVRKAAASSAEKET
ncbi:hypothetical protein DAPPUDRAFT_254376 [Daphnia pulex]|uniref:RRM domain-containing protein n=1 Tax=Daphnia pulex TaxID=6669 RepID=E9H711_DAPPU|nr:hypothetical protein DAPPUDRAFT_254376 [Daphnia pulex]|eukprot:EFX72437.1 hypothetical protein DAPPUDRAFT_254376 [Daphnia pulex]